MRPLSTDTKPEAQDMLFELRAPGARASLPAKACVSTLNAQTLFINVDIIG